MNNNKLIEQYNSIKDKLSIEQNNNVEILLNNLPDEILNISQISIIDLDLDCENDVYFSWKSNNIVHGIVIFYDNGCALSIMGHKYPLIFFDNCNQLISTLNTNDQI